MYYDGFEVGITDNCIVAEENDGVIGAAWMYDKMGFKTIDENTEEYIMGCKL